MFLKYIISCCSDILKNENSWASMLTLHMLSCFMSYFSDPWTVAHKAPISMGFIRQEYFSGLPGPPAGDLPDPRIWPASLKSPALAGGFFTSSAIWEALSYILYQSSWSLTKWPTVQQVSQASFICHKEQSISRSSQSKRIGTFQTISSGCHDRL